MGETERAYAASEARAYAAVRQERGLLRQQLADARAGWSKAANDCREACLERDHECDRAETAEHELAKAKESLGSAWLSGGVSLAEGIRRKMRALEGLEPAWAAAWAVVDAVQASHHDDVLPSLRDLAGAAIAAVLAPPELTPADPMAPTVAVPRDLVEAIVHDLREGLAVERETGEELAALLGDGTARTEPGTPGEDTRDWYWRASDGETRPEGPYPTREAALADVLGYYAVGELPDGVYVGRCTDPMTMAGACAETICERVEEQLAEHLEDVRVELVDSDAAQEALDAWVRDHVMVTDPAWMTDPAEEWVELSEPEEGGAA